MRVWSMVLAGLAGLYGAAGVGLAAVGAHAGAGPNVTTAAYFLLIHAAAVIGACALVGSGGGKTVLVAASLWAFGAFLFSGELALHALTGMSPAPLAAPTGGLAMIAGWLLAGVGLPSLVGACLAGRAPGGAQRRVQRGETPPEG